MNGAVKAASDCNEWAAAMTDRRYDPVDFAEIERAKLDATVQEFMERRISDDVFRALLKCRGFNGVRLRDEFSYWDTTRYQTRE